MLIPANHEPIVGWTTPGGFDLKFIADIGYEFALIQPYTKNLFYKVGLALSYSFDLEEEKYKAIKKKRVK